jgi:hypothetical protein
VGGKGGGGSRGGAMTQALYAHMNNKRKKNEGLEVMLALLCSMQHYSPYSRCRNKLNVHVKMRG